MKSFKAFLIVIFVAAIASQYSSNPYDPTQKSPHAPGMHNPNSPNGGVHNPNAGANHVFLVKTDLTKEQVEALLKRAEVEAAMEPEEPVEQPEMEANEAEPVEPMEEKPAKAAHNAGNQQHGGNKKSAHTTQALETELAAQDPANPNPHKTKEQKIQQKADKAAKKQADMEAQRQAKNAKAEQKKADQLAKQKQKQEKAAMKAKNAEMKKAEKEQKVLDKQNKKLTEEPITEFIPEEPAEEALTEELVQSTNPAHAAGAHNKKASKNNTPVLEEVTVVTEIDEEGLTQLRGVQSGQGGKGSAHQAQAQGQGATTQKRDRKQIHVPKKTQPETSEPTEAEGNPSPTNLLKMTEPKKEVSISSFVALFMILFTFVALIILATQYESIKRHFKMDFKNEGLTDYLLVDERHEERRSDYPNIRDF